MITRVSHWLKVYKALCKYRIINRESGEIQWCMKFTNRMKIQQQQQQQFTIYNNKTKYYIPYTKHIHTLTHWHNIVQLMEMVVHVIHYDFHIISYHPVPLLYSRHCHHVQILLMAMLHRHLVLH